MTPKTAALDTIAHWSQITRQALADATYIRSLIETKLRRGLAPEDRSRPRDAAQRGDPSAGRPAPTSCTPSAIGIGLVESAGYDPNAVLLNPADYAALDLVAYENANTGPARQANFWGLKPISSPTQPAAPPSSAISRKA